MTLLLEKNVFDPAFSNHLPTKLNFDTVNFQTKKTPESLTNPGGIKHDSVQESVKMDANISILSQAPNSYKDYGENVTNSRFIKFIPSESSDWLLENHPNAFLLLCLIAKRARRFNGHVDGLEIGMAKIGDFEKAGIETERKYRTAKDVLIRMGAIKIVETARKRKKPTTGKTTKSTTKGTLVILLQSDIWDINPDYKDDQIDDQIDDRPTTDRRPTDDEQERKERKEDIYVKETFNVSRSPLPNKNKNDATEIPNIPSSSIFDETPEQGSPPRSEEQFQEDLILVNHFIQQANIILSAKDVSRWIRKWFGFTVISNLKLLTQQKKTIDNPAAWMETALKGDWAKLKKNEPINKIFSEEFKKKNNWIDLTITQKYCTIENASYDIPFNFEPENFKQILIEKYENLSRTHDGQQNY